MKLYDVCDRCGKILSIREMDGPGYILDDMLTRMPKDRGIHIGCGGHVHLFSEKEVNSFIFRLQRWFKSLRGN